MCMYRALGLLVGKGNAQLDVHVIVKVLRYHEEEEASGHCCRSIMVGILNLLSPIYPFHCKRQLIAFFCLLSFFLGLSLKATFSSGTRGHYYPGHERARSDETSCPPSSAR